jgi:hypothetical protein
MTDETTFKFTGKKAMIVLGVVIVLVLLRLMTIGESNDPKLREAIRMELMNRLGGRTGQALSEIDKTDPEAVRALAEQADPEGIQVHSMKVSKPLLSFGSKEDVIVQVEFSLPGSFKQKEYWRFKHSLIAGWRYKRRSTALSYYLNFL